MNQNQIRIIQDDYWDTFGNQLIEFLDLTPNIKVLDVGTGGGTILIPAANKVLPDGEVIGIDDWSDAIRRAKANIEHNKLTNARAIKMDGNKIKFADNTFDVVTSGFVGYCNIFDFNKLKMKPGKKNSLIREALRVLKPGCKAGFSTWELQEDLGIIQKIVKDDTVHPGYSKENVKGFNILMEEAGFQNITTHTLEYHRYFDTIEDWAEKNKWLVRNFDLEPLRSYQNYFDPFYNEDIEKIDFRKCVIYAIGEKKSS